MLRTTAAVLLLASPALADTAPLAFFIHHENDGTFVKANDNTDRHYTSGAKVVLAHQPAFALAWANALEDAAPFLGTGFDRAAIGYVVGQNIYTPEDLGRTTPNPDDHPYGGWLYGGAFWERSSADTLDHVELTLGAIGSPSLAERTQKWIHRHFTGETPHGWPHQLRDEPTIQLDLRRKWKLWLLGEDDWRASGGAKGWGLQAIPQVGLSAGSVYRNLNAGVTVRFGWALPDDFGPGRIEDVTSVTGELRPAHRPLSVYVFGRLGGKAVEHDVFIEGNQFRDSPGRDERELVGEGQVGVALRWKWFEASYSQTFRTLEFYGQQESDAFGAIVLGGVWEF